MRIRIHHITHFDYALAPRHMIQHVRLTPRNHAGQYVIQWRITVDSDARLYKTEDAFGNIVHSFSLDNPGDQVFIHAEGLVETTDTQGVLTENAERLPPAVFLRHTSLTQPEAVVQAFAADVGGKASGKPLAYLHALMTAIYETMVFDANPTHVATTAEEALTLKRGVCQDFAHIFVAAARLKGIPARYVGGYFLRTDGVLETEAGHAWAEAYVDGLGWIGFDPAHGLCATDQHVRIACGLDYRDASPTKGSRRGGAGERLSVQVHTGEQERKHRILATD